MKKLKKKVAKEFFLHVMQLMVVQHLHIKVLHLNEKEDCDC